MSMVMGGDGKFELPSRQQAIEMWRKGESVWSAELGGIGPGYEQAIQVLLWEILSEWGERSLPEPEVEGEYPHEYSKFIDEMVHKLDESCGGFSGAQVGAAKATAYQFLKYGYRHMMGKLEKERHILVSTAWPRPAQRESRGEGV